MRGFARTLWVKLLMAVCRPAAFPWLRIALQNAANLSGSTAFLRSTRGPASSKSVAGPGPPALPGRRYRQCPAECPRAQPDLLQTCG